MKLVLSVILFAVTTSSLARAEPPASTGLPYAETLPGHPGYVRSPYQADGIVDVRGLARDAQARDPFTGKFFLVPLTTPALPEAPVMGKAWDPATAAADARADIAAKRLRFACVGGRGSYAPGLPSAAYQQLERYPRLDVGPQGCNQDGYSGQRHRYAIRYNEIMWAFVSRHP